MLPSDEVDSGSVEGQEHTQSPQTVADVAHLTGLRTWKDFALLFVKVAIDTATPVWTMFLVSISVLVSAPFASTVWLRFCQVWLLLAPLSMMMWLIFVSAEVACRQWVYTRLLQNNIVLQFRSHSVWRGWRVLVVIVTNVSIILYYTYRASSKISLTFTILLQSYSLFSLYRRMYLQQGEGHLITLADVLSSDGSDSLADASARQHILDSATPLSERDLRDLVLTLGSNCDLTYNLRLDWPALPRKASRLPPLNQHDRHDFLREEGRVTWLSFTLFRYFFATRLLLRKKRLMEAVDISIHRTLWCLITLSIFVVLIVESFGVAEFVLRKETCSTSVCSDCVAEPFCGWCARTRTCQTGSESGSAGGKCFGPGWSFDSCPSDNGCSTASSCEGCSERSGCGWCADSGQCLSGSSTGPSTTNGCSAGWSWQRSQCPPDPCMPWNSCQSCASQTLCGFCVNNGDCLSGSSLGSDANNCFGEGWVFLEEACPGTPP